MSKLDEINREFREKLMTKNGYNVNGEYVVAHKNALSDGDEWGKGELNGSVGGQTDIIKRTTLMSKNMYNKNNEYNIGNNG